MAKQGVGVILSERRTRSQDSYQQLVPLNWLLFDEDLHAVSDIDVPLSLFNNQVRHCRKLFAEEILKRYEGSVEVESIEFWRPKADLPVDTLIDEQWRKTNSDIKVLAKPVALSRSLSATLGGKGKDVEIVHIIVTARKNVSLNWVFFNPKHTGGHNVSKIHVPPSLYNDKVRHCRNLFVEEILAKYESSVTVRSLRFWKPVEPFSVVNASITAEKWNKRFNPIELAQSFSEVLAGELNDATIVHIVVTAEEESKKESSEVHGSPAGKS
ncbi:hypothetical protein Clacol_001073 [Clathrus columnatus]|uniref:Uncharacterized protein n=1 Tax=Clathrus columnatus TaxID=1419009 RepID=A0AAV5A016_9AGAM|nr:hypothetical protein Clacol_001073 [Clathrus columnatus]